MKYLLLAWLCFSGIYAYSQGFTIPPGYTISKDFNGGQQRIDADFDNDGINDLAIACIDKNNETMIMIFLAGQWMTTNIYAHFPWEMENNTFIYKNNVLTMSSNSCMGRCFKALKFKYYPSLNTMRLIGYDEEYLGNNIDKPYLKTVNLLTGQYEIGGVMRSFTLGKVITLSDIEKYFDYLGALGANYYPK